VQLVHPIAPVRSRRCAAGLRRLEQIEACSLRIGHHRETPTLGMVGGRGINLPPKALQLGGGAIDISTAM